jgi:hypothetical protein
MLLSVRVGHRASLAANPNAGLNERRFQTLPRRRKMLVRTATKTRRDQRALLEERLELYSHPPTTEWHGTWKFLS